MNLNQWGEGEGEEGEDWEKAYTPTKSELLQERFASYMTIGRSYRSPRRLGHMIFLCPEQNFLDQLILPFGPMF